MSEELAEGVDLNSEFPADVFGMSPLSTLAMTGLVEAGTDISSDVPLQEVDERQLGVFQNSKVNS